MSLNRIIEASTGAQSSITPTKTNVPEAIATTAIENEIKAENATENPIVEAETSDEELNTVLDSTEAIDDEDGNNNRQNASATTNATISISSFERVAATQSDIVRSSQKDAYYMALLDSQVTELASGLYGIRFVMAHRNKLQTGTKLVYLLLTTLRGVSTLGEEYVGIMQFDRVARQYPSLVKRAVSTLLLTFGCGATAALAKKLPFSQEQSSVGVKWYYTAVQKLNLAVFYLFGTYYDLSKRVVGIEFHKLRRLASGEQKTGYELLGAMMLAQFAIAAIRQALSAFNTNSLKQNPVETTTSTTAANKDAHTGTVLGADKSNPWAGRQSELSNSSSNEAPCNLCLSSPLISPSATSCGHIFCWNCIFEWLNSNSACPLCRQDIKQAHLLPLYAYASS